MTERPAMNPASIIWPERTPDPVTLVTSQGKRKEERPVVILNRDWKPAPRFLGWGGDDGDE